MCTPSRCPYTLCVKIHSIFNITSHSEDNAFILFSHWYSRYSVGISTFILITCILFTESSCSQQVQISWKLVSIVTNGLFNIHSSQVCVFFKFLAILVNFINFYFIANDCCHSHSRHSISYHISHKVLFHVL